jgi:hypothetical protein
LGAYSIPFWRPALLIPSVCVNDELKFRRIVNVYENYAENEKHSTIGSLHRTAINNGADQLALGPSRRSRKFASSLIDGITGEGKAQSCEMPGYRAFRDPVPFPPVFPPAKNS